jgi:hypothetical protein
MPIRVASLLVALAALATSMPVEACGDKFVRVGRGGRFQRGYVAIHPSSIVVFVNPSSADASTMRKLPSTLKAAGHKAISVSTAAALADALRAQRYDLVMAEAADLPSLSAALAGITPAPGVLPVAASPAKYQVLVDIDEALGATRK